MNILICIKQVPETNKVEVDPKTGVLKRDGVDSKMNPYDLYALEAALRLVEQYGGKTAVMTMGPPQAAEMIKEAFSMGVDEGYLVTDRRFAGADVLATSYTLSQAIRKAGEFDLILCGKQTTDGDTAQVGSEISEYLKIPSVAGVTKLLDVTDTDITVESDLPNTVELLRVNFPCLLCTEKEINVPRLPSYLKKMQSKEKQITTYTLDDFNDRNEKKYGLSGSPTQVQRIFPPEVNRDRELWEGCGEELCEKMLHTLKTLKFV